MPSPSSPTSPDSRFQDFIISLSKNQCQKTHVTLHSLSSSQKDLLLHALQETNSLRRLSFRGTKITNQDMDFVARLLRENDSIEELDLRDNQINEEGLRPLCAALKDENQSLSEVLLCGNHLEGSSLELELLKERLDRNRLLGHFKPIPPHVDLINMDLYTSLHEQLLAVHTTRTRRRAWSALVDTVLEFSERLNEIQHSMTVMNELLELWKRFTARIRTAMTTPEIVNRVCNDCSSLVEEYSIRFQSIKELSEHLSTVARNMDLHFKRLLDIQQSTVRVQTDMEDNLDEDSLKELLRELFQWKSEIQSKSQALDTSASQFLAHVFQKELSLIVSEGNEMLDVDIDNLNEQDCCGIGSPPAVKMQRMALLKVARENCTAETQHLALLQDEKMSRRLIVLHQYFKRQHFGPFDEMVEFSNVHLTQMQAQNDLCSKFKDRLCRIGALVESLQQIKDKENTLREELCNLVSEKQHTRNHKSTNNSLEKRIEKARSALLTKMAEEDSILKELILLNQAGFNIGNVYPHLSEFYQLCQVPLYRCTLMASGMCKEIFEDLRPLLSRKSMHISRHEEVFCGRIHNVEYVLKAFPRERLDFSTLGYQVKLLERSLHRNIIRLAGGFIQEDCVYVMFILFSQGSLREWCTKNRDRINYRTWKSIWYQTLCALEHIHALGIIHCDVTPPNIYVHCLSEEKDAQNTNGETTEALPKIHIVLGDFDFSSTAEQRVERWQEISQHHTMDREYAPPELKTQLAREVTSAADIFSWAECVRSIMGDVLKRDEYSELRSLVHQCSEEDPTQRLVASQALCHPYFSKEYKHGVDPAIPSYWDSFTSPEDVALVDMSDEMIPKMQSLIDFSCGTNLGHGRDQKVKERYNHLRVVGVQHVENKELWKKYKERAQELLENDRGEDLENCSHSADPITDKHFWVRTQELNHTLNEKMLFHGTRAKLVPILAYYGFDERKSSLDSMMGSGIYCAEYSSKSDQYCVPDGPDGQTYVILLCRVMMGVNIFETDTPVLCMLHAPNLPNDLGDTFDSVFYNPQDPDKYREFVVYSKHQVYPEWVIEYRREYVKGAERQKDAKHVKNGTKHETSDHTHPEKH